MAKEPKGAADAAKDDVERFEFTLQEPINVFGEMVSVLKWRKPNGADFIRVGSPIVPNIDGRIEHDMPRVVAMVSRITDAPTSSLERMTTNDIAKWGYILMPFFLPAD